MSAGLFGLFDDVAAIARAAAASVDDVAGVAAKATATATGVVVDDTAVLPQYLDGVTPERELPIVRRIALGSLRNKLLIILPALLILDQFLHAALAPILFLGGVFLAFEGAEKVLEWLGDSEVHAQTEPEGGAEDTGQAMPSEDALVRSAIRTDLVLSAEIMMISSASLGAQTFWSRLIVLVVVAVVITVGVYGLVALIVKMDDIGLHLLRREPAAARAVGRGLVEGMPRLLSCLSVVGVFAMLWVGGHIQVTQVAAMGWHEPHRMVAVWGDHIGGIGGWIVTTVCAGVIGLAVGLLLVLGASAATRPALLRRGRETR